MKYLKFVVVGVLLLGGFLIYQQSATQPQVTQNEFVANITGCDQSYNNLQEALQSPLRACKLDLSSQGLKTLPAEIGKLENLQELVVVNNELTGFPAEVGKFKNLTILDLSKNKITDVPAEIGHLSNLENLDLSSNQLDTMPDEFAQLKKLKKLNLAGNNYKDVPQEIYSMTALEELDISGNKLDQGDINTLKAKLPQVKLVVE